MKFKIVILPGMALFLCCLITCTAQSVKDRGVTTFNLRFFGDPMGCIDYKVNETIRR
jgi:hypothetical protein